MLFFLFNLLYLAVTVLSARLTLSRPLDEQLPLIARLHEPYSWTFSNRTFASDEGPLEYSTSTLPQWLSFDADKLTFFGTPSTSDEGDTRITVTAKDSSSTASSSFSLCVTSTAKPEVYLSIQNQFLSSRPSLSSVFPLAPNSALKTGNPALRIPGEWSFSIGFEYGTCRSGDEIYYDVRTRDDNDLPAWMFFNRRAMTLNGVSPNSGVIPQPAIVPLFLFCSDQDSYYALSFPFDVIVSSHELSIFTTSLPTINITATTSFSISLFSSDNYAGVLVDGKAIQPHEILDLEIDTSQYNSWLKYDQRTRTLSGDPGNSSLVQMDSPMPVSLTSIFNQTLKTLVSLHVEPSYFLNPNLPPVEATQGSLIQFNLRQHFSNATSHDSNVHLAASFGPLDTAQYLQFDDAKAQLMGTIPLGYPVFHIVVTFTAYSTVTHSTSHTRLPIILQPVRPKTGADSSTNKRTHSKLVLGLSVTFGIFGSLCLMIGLLAIFRRWARVPDSAIGDEEGKNVWSEKDQKWYERGLQMMQEGYQRTPAGKLTSLDHTTSRSRSEYGNLGLGLRRVSERSRVGLGFPTGIMRSPGVMSKREFIAKIKNTVRVVSDKARGRTNSRPKLFISHPMLPDQPTVPGNHEVTTITISPQNRSEGIGVQSLPGSTILSNSPSSSTAEHSIPRRRADFGPLKHPNQVHAEDNQLSRQSSSGSTDSSSSNASTKAHTADGVIRAVSKVVDLRHGVDVKESFPGIVPAPRLVPFTSEARVPVPHFPTLTSSSNLTHDGPKRINSQKALIWKQPRKSGDMSSVMEDRSRNELEVGLRYVQSFGAHQNNAPEDIVVAGNSTTVDGASFSDNASKGTMTAVLRSGEKFRLRVPLPPATKSAPQAGKLDVKLVSGNPLPKFLQVDYGLKGALEFYGTPGPGDVSRIVIGIYNHEGLCIKTVTIEIVKWR